MEFGSRGGTSAPGFVTDIRASLPETNEFGEETTPSPFGDTDSPLVTGPWYSPPGAPYLEVPLAALSKMSTYDEIAAADEGVAISPVVTASR